MSTYDLTSGLMLRFSFLPDRMGESFLFEDTIRSSLFAANDIAGIVEVTGIELQVSVFCTILCCGSIISMDLLSTPMQGILL